jgi:membrane-bound lytic murein transglycosylase
MKRKSSLFSSLFLLILLNACKVEDPSPEGGTSIDDGFAQGLAGWKAGFSDHPKLNNQQDSNLYELGAKWAKLPSEISGEQQGGFEIKGHNRSDDLFMFITKKVTNLRPNTTYQVQMELVIASDAIKGSVGIGGSPAESVYVKTGAFDQEPKPVLNTADWRMNLDKGEQSQSGQHMKVIGDLVNGGTQEKYRVFSRKLSSALEIKTNTQGELWLIAGTDSGYEGLTKLYYLRVKADLKVRE